MNRELSYVGKRYPSISARQKVTGAAKYSVDLAPLPGTLVGKYLTSPHPHARIRSIDKSLAKQLPGVAAVISWDDIPKQLINPSIQKWTLHDGSLDIEDMYVISEKARFVGDIVAAVAAVDEATALKALSLIKVDYEVLPAVLSMADAMKPGAPAVHDGVPDNISQTAGFAGNRGDVDATLAQAEVVVELSVETSRQHPMALEPLTCTAAFDGNGDLTCWTPTQRPMTYRRAVAELFGLTEARVNIVCEFGGGFYGEANWPIVPVCVALAKSARKPVRVEFTREELVAITPSRETYVVSGKLGFSKDGTLLAAQHELLVDSGAYFNRSNATATVCFGIFSSIYRLPAFRGKLTAVYSNTPMTSGHRGYGGPAALVLLDQLMDMAAEKLGMDPLDLRLKNVKRAGERAIFFPMETDTHFDLIEQGAERFGWKEKRSRNRTNGTRRRGIGMSTFHDVSGAQPNEVMDRHCVMTLEPDGSVTVTLNHPDGGMNLLTSCVQIAAETSGLRPEDFRFVHAATKGARYDVGMGANAGMYGMGNLFVRAGANLKNEILSIAAKQLGFAPEDLDIEKSEIVTKSDGRRKLSVKELAASILMDHTGGSGRQITIPSSFTPRLNPAAPSAVFIDLQVDAETGVIEIDRLLFVHDCGRPINPNTVEGQLVGGIVHGLGHTLFEDISINRVSGAIEGSNLNRYKLPSTLDLPEIEVLLFEQPCESGPFGAKAVGMCGTHGIPAAVANALCDALGVRMSSMPFSAERVLSAIHAGRESSQSGSPLR